LYSASAVFDRQQLAAAVVGFNGIRSIRQLVVARDCNLLAGNARLCCARAAADAEGVNVAVVANHRCGNITYQRIDFQGKINHYGYT